MGLLLPDFYSGATGLSGCFSEGFSLRCSQTWAEMRLARFISEHEGYFNGSELGWPGIVKRAGLLFSIRAELEYLFADRESVIKALASRAFAHLQRSIVVDRRIAESWRSAFKKKEPICEKLGAVHLLLFGIYAFKVDAIGERTDLVFGTPANLLEAGRIAEALVLTEWKLVRQPSELGAKIKEARAQADAYAGGSLAGLELSSRRYLLMVSSEVMRDLPSELPGGPVTYEVVNIAVNPPRQPHGRGSVAGLATEWRYLRYSLPSGSIAPERKRPSGAFSQPMPLRVSGGPSRTALVRFGAGLWPRQLAPSPPTESRAFGLGT